MVIRVLCRFPKKELGLSMKLFWVLLFYSFSGTESGKFGTIPDDDPHEEPPGKFNVSLPPLMEVYKGSNHSGYRIVGLSKLQRDTDYDPLRMRLDFEVGLPRIQVSGGQYFLGGWIDVTPLREETFPSGEMGGLGPFFWYNMTKFHLEGKATFALKSGNRPSVKELKVKTLTFESVEADLGHNFTIEGEPVNWVELFKTFKTNFYQDFEDKKEEIVEKVRRTINNVIEKYQMSDLLTMFGEEDVIKTGLKFIPQSETFFSSNRKIQGKRKKKKQNDFPSVFDTFLS